MFAMRTIAARTRLSRARREFDSPRDVWLIARMLGWACVLRVLKHQVPLPRLVHLARWNGPVRPLSIDQQEKVVTLARWACRPMQWLKGGNCLELSLIHI